MAAQVATSSSDTHNVRELASYVWQYYLPRLPFQRPFHAPGTDYGLYDVFVKQTMGAFGWLEVVFPAPVYWLLTAVLAAIAAGAIVALVRRRRTLNWGALLFLLAAWLTLLAGLHWTEYKQLASSAGGFIQGRYLFPMIAVGGVVVASAISALPRRWQPHAVGLLLGGLVTFQLFSLGLVAARFYA